jgi:hypothetical protein
MSTVLASVQLPASWGQASSSLRMRSLQAFAYEQVQVHQHLGLWSLDPKAASASSCCSWLRCEREWERVLGMLWYEAATILRWLRRR